MKKRTTNLIETIRKHYELIFFLTYREIRIRYKQTILGIAWAVIQPLLQMVVFTFVFSRLGQMSSEGVPYPIFVLAGLLPWGFFASALSRGVPIIINYPNLVTKIYFPREIFPMFATFGLLADFLFGFIILLGFMIAFQLPLHLGIAASFLVVFALVLFTLGVLFVAATANVFFRDATYAVGLLTQVWFFLTPIAYPLEKVPHEFLFWYKLNPMVGLIQSYRDLLLRGTISDPSLLLQSVVLSIITFYFGYLFLKRHEMKFADVI